MTTRRSTPACSHPPSSSGDRRIPVSSANRELYCPSSEGEPDRERHIPCTSGGSPLGVSVRRDCLFCNGHRVDSTGRCWSGKRADEGYAFLPAVPEDNHRIPIHTVCPAGFRQENFSKNLHLYCFLRGAGKFPFLIRKTWIFRRL